MEIFQLGISDKDQARMKLWPYLLGVYIWDVSEDERQTVWQAKVWVTFSCQSIF